MPVRVVTFAVAAFMAVDVASGCGASDEEQVRATLDRFERATAERDVATLCGEVLATSMTARIEEVGLTCEDAWRTGLSTVRQPTLDVEEVRIDGDAAEVDVRAGARGQQPAAVTVELVHEPDGWRIADLGEAGPPTPGG